MSNYTNYYPTCYSIEESNIEQWIRDIKEKLLRGKYNNRIRLQKQLIALEKAEHNLSNCRKEYFKKAIEF